MRVTARACANIALVKYWGKRDLELNLPAAGSISLTLDSFTTVTTVEFLAGPGPDEVWIDDAPAAEGAAWRTTQFLDLVRSLAKRCDRARVETRNTFPTGVGLASSSSGFAALALAASRALGLDLSQSELSALARRGSGSAARSLCAGFVEMYPGSRSDGSDAVARPLAPPNHWDVRLVAALTGDGRKALGSSEAMIRTAETSPLYSGWLASVPPTLERARTAILTRDLRALGEVMEHSALTMHASAIAARPPILYWNPVTVAAIRAVWDLRRSGVEAYFTIDAGPHVKVLCAVGDAPKVEEALRGVPGVLRTLEAAPGPAARLIAEGV
jgi:diphosphomevalonate decarboxylase